MTAQPRAVVIAVGNEFRRDDGVGAVVLAELAKRELPPDVVLVRSDGEPTNLLEVWAGLQLAVVIDAVLCEPGVPGKLHRTTLAGSMIPRAASSHALGVPEAVQLAEALDRAPQELVVYAVEAGDLGFGVGLSDAVTEALPEVVQAVLAEVTENRGHPRAKAHG